MSWIAQINNLKAVTWLATLLTAMLSTFTSLVAAGFWAFYGDRILTVARFQLGIEELAEQLQNVTGENRVIRQPRGLSYVVAPVYEGERVQFYLTISRTTLGKNCDFKGGTAIFEDVTGVPNAGGHIERSRHVGLTPEKLRLIATQPTMIPLVPGRVMLMLALEYDCAGDLIIESTDPMWFTLLPADAPRPAAPAPDDPSLE